MFTMYPGKSLFEDEAENIESLNDDSEENAAGATISERWLQT